MSDPVLLALIVAIQTVVDHGLAQLYKRKALPDRRHNRG